MDSHCRSLLTGGIRHTLNQFRIESTPLRNGMWEKSRIILKDSLNTLHGCQDRNSQTGLGKHILLQFIIDARTLFGSLSHFVCATIALPLKDGFYLIYSPDRPILQLQCFFMKRHTPQQILYPALDRRQRVFIQRFLLRFSGPSGGSSHT